MTKQSRRNKILNIDQAKYIDTILACIVKVRLHLHDIHEPVLQDPVHECYDKLISIRTRGYYIIPHTGHYINAQRDFLNSFAEVYKLSLQLNTLGESYLDIGNTEAAESYRIYNNMMILYTNIANILVQINNDYSKISTTSTNNI